MRKQSVPTRSGGRRSAGFTLMELMVVLALIGVMMGIAVPNFREFIRNSRLTSTANDLVVSLNRARTEAVKRQLPVAVCATNNSNATPPVCSSGAYTSWVVWVDADNDWVPDNNVNEPVLTRQPAVDATVFVRVSNAESGRVKYLPSGFAAPPDGTATPTRNVVVCDERGAESLATGARALLITATGRARVTRDSTEIGDALTAIGASCP